MSPNGTHPRLKVKQPRCGRRSTGMLPGSNAGSMFMWRKNRSGHRRGSSPWLMRPSLETWIRTRRAGKVFSVVAATRPRLPTMPAAAGDVSNPGETMVEAFGSTRSTTASNTTPKNSNVPSKRSEGSSFLTRTMTMRSMRVTPEASSRNLNRSGRGHDFDGGGVGTGNGQLAQVCRPWAWMLLGVGVCVRARARMCV